VELVKRISEDIGITGPNSISSIFTFDGNEWRTWATYYLLSTTLSIARRVPRSLSFSANNLNQLFRVEYLRDGLSTDTLLCQYLRASHLCEQIVFETKLTTNDTVLDGSEPSAQETIRRLGNLILDWKAQIPPSLRCTPHLKLWEEVSELYLHEFILHTPSNKQSFNSPYIASRLSVTDFPAPIVTQQHIVSLYNIRDASHRLLNFYTSLDVPTVLSTPAISSTARTAYALWVLIKLYIATTAPGSTYGAFLDAESLQVDKYMEAMTHLGEKVKEVDLDCGAVKILQAPIRLREWVENYRVNHLTLPLAPNIYPNTMVVGHGNLMASAGEIDWTEIVIPDEQFQFGLEDLFGGL